MKNSTPLNPPLLKKNDTKVRWSGLKGSSASLAIYELAKSADQAPLLLIASDIQSARRYQQELSFFSGKSALPIFLFPDWETLPYDHFSPHQDLISERLYTLYRMPLISQGIIIIALPTLMHRLMPPEHLRGNSLAMNIGEKISFQNLREQLITAGYHSVNQVMEHGEFAIRGSIIDIYPMGNSLPFRIELFDDEIETIRSFNPENQLTLEKLEHIKLLPAKEYPLTPAAIELFRQNWRIQFSGNPKEALIYQRISNGESVAGVEYYLSLFYQELSTFFDYLPPTTELILTTDLFSTAEHFWLEVEQRFQQLSGDIQRPLCPPESIFIKPNDLFRLMKSFKQIQIYNDDLDQISGSVIHFDTLKPKQFLIDYRAKKPWEPIQQYLQQFSGRILLCAESNGRREILLENLAEIGYFPESMASWHDFITSNTKIAITVNELDRGLLIPFSPSLVTAAPVTEAAEQISSADIILTAENKSYLSVITETQLFGEQVMQRRMRDKPRQDPDAIIKHLTELQVGAPVVHLEFGVGRYLGLQLISADGRENEYLTLEYADGDKIYVPVTSLHLISRYTGSHSDQAPLHKLGSKQWQTIKQKVAKQVADTAAELLDIYSKRQAATGFAFAKPDQDFHRFRQLFPFEETPDQNKAINDVIHDMIEAKCMDRLVCGDVGFGKTEVAMQAAFLAIQSHKQIAVLVPTTLLANQHRQNFQDRMADWPVKIAELSRLRSAKEQKNTLAGIANGTVDIVIGTHKLLSNEIKFKDLGLLIVDEEHRFGVKQKEKIKALRAHVDILTLTATPIPRTLNMAFAGMRDLSMITTPPAKRLAIKTFVYEYQPSIIREAILRETLRGGQVFYLHNEVATIEAEAQKLLKIVPEIRVAIAHGQMHERELEKVMIDFYHQKFNVLLCTTIVESGIDIPSANTIIINRADRFGLAQLHQLRGRVGRSHHQAYAYLLVNNKKAISADAKKRLEAISQLEDLGVGFHLATHDLEIRGAGELLGEEQSGHIEDIGFSLYMEMLEDAVKALKSDKKPNFEDRILKQNIDVNLHLSAFIPETYVNDVNLRLSFYKQLAGCKDVTMIENLKSNWVDRFGQLPATVQQLLNITKLKILAEKIGIQKINANNQFVYLHFNEKPNVDPGFIIQLIQKNPQTYHLQSNQVLRYRLPAHQESERFSLVHQLLIDLTTS